MENMVSRGYWFRAEVRVALVDDDDLDDSERAKLHAAILAGEAELDAGQAVSEGELWSRLRAIRQGLRPGGNLVQDRPMVNGTRRFQAIPSGGDSARG